MDIDPGVWLIMEGTEEIIARLPNDVPAHVDEIVLSIDGGPEVTYKVEKVVAVCTYLNTATPGLPDTSEAHGRTNLLVSIVP